MVNLLVIFRVQNLIVPFLVLLTLFLLLLLIAYLIGLYNSWKAKANVSDAVPVKKDFQPDSSSIQIDHLVISEVKQQPKKKFAKRLVERRTYFKGIFRGKFAGNRKDIEEERAGERFFNLEITEGEAEINFNDFRKWQIGGEFEEFIHQPVFHRALPNPLPVIIIKSEGLNQLAKLEIKDAKLMNIRLSKHQQEGDLIFGVIEAEIGGYLLKYDEVIEEVIESVILPPINVYPPAISEGRTKTNVKTGRSEVNGNYIRWEYFYSDKTTFWGGWILQEGKANGNIEWNILLWIAGIIILFVLALMFWFLSPVLLPIIVIGGLIYLFANFEKVFIYIGRIFLSILGVVIIIAVASALVNSFHQQHHRVVVQTSDTTEVKKPTSSTDSLISNHRVWKDYSGRNYSGDLVVWKRDYNSSATFRNSQWNSCSTNDQYSNLVFVLEKNDRSYLDSICAMFKSIKQNRNLDSIRYAEMIVSCIQDIPYKLVLAGDCNPALYQETFVKKYLKDGGDCDGFVKFGLYSPCEFMANLHGDCDTRALLVYSLLTHEGYDVVMLSSYVYGHSIIGINEKGISGVNKLINNKRYVLWETTAFIQPGVIPNSISIMRYWELNLQSKI